MNWLLNELASLLGVTETHCRIKHRPHHQPPVKSAVWHKPMVFCAKCNKWFYQ